MKRSSPSNAEVITKYASSNIPYSTEKADVIFHSKTKGGPGSHKQTASRISGLGMRIVDCNPK